MGDNKDSEGISIREVEDLAHNFLLVVLQHSMRKKDGWKVRYSDILFLFRSNIFYRSKLPFSVVFCLDCSFIRQTFI